MSISLLLEMAVSGGPDRTAVVSGDLRLTTEELSTLADGGAGVIATSGAAHVAYVGTGGALLPLLLFASARAAVPFTPLNYRLSRDGLHELIERLPEPLVIADAEYADVVAGTGKQVITSEEFLAAARTNEPAAEFADPDAVAVVLFTSGTTSRPKAVELTHNNLTSYITGTVEFGAAAEEDAALICVPPYHIAGVSAAMSNLYAGRKMVYLRHFDADKWVELVRTEGVTSATVVPTMLDRIVTALETAGLELPTLRNLAYGGSKVALPLVRKALQLLPNVGFVNAYGLTETSSTIAVLGPDDHREALAAEDASGARRLGSVGQVVPGLEVQIRADDGTRQRMSPCSTRAATCSSADDPTTPSSAVGRTLPRPRSRTCSSSIPRSATSPSSAPKIPSGARSSWPSWYPPRGPPPTRMHCANMCANSCAVRAPRTGWCSVTSCPPTRPARCCAASSSTNSPPSQSTPRKESA